MTNTSVAETLKAEADVLLFRDGVDTLLRKYGSVTYTGSYALRHLKGLLSGKKIDSNSYREHLEHKYL